MNLPSKILLYLEISKAQLQTGIGTYHENQQLSLIYFAT